MEKVKVKFLDKKAITPTRGHDYDAGLDLYCIENTAYKPGELVKVPTGIAVQIPVGYVGFIRDRSSVSLTKLKVTAGIIDAGYTGEVNVVILNLSGDHGCIKAGQKIAQLLILPVMLPKVEVVEDFESEGGREAKGFGSTGQYYGKTLGMDDWEN